MTKNDFKSLCASACRNFVPSYSKTNDLQLLYYRLFNLLAKSVGMSEHCVNFKRENDTQWYVYNISQLVKTHRAETFDFQKIAEQEFNLARR